MTIKKENIKQNSEKNIINYDFEEAYMASKEYETLLAKTDKNNDEQERMNEIYEGLKNEAPYLLDFFG